MKKLFFVLLILFPLFSISQNNQFDFSEVVSVDSTSSDKLFIRAVSWFAETYKSSQNVIQLSDQKSGTIIGKAVFESKIKSFGTWKDYGYVNYTITVLVKENRYKYVIDNIFHDYPFTKGVNGGSLNDEEPDCSKSMITQKYWETIKSDAFNDFTQLIYSLKIKMQTDAEAEKW